MKISVDDQVIFSLTETQKSVIKNDISDEVFDEDMKRRLKYIIQHKYEQCFKRLKEEWEPIFKREGAKSIPLNSDEFAQLVFDHPEYKSKKIKDDEKIAAEAISRSDSQAS